MGILASILGAGDVITKGMELIDNMHTSTEEEILAKTQAKVNLMNAYAPFKLAQRVLAILFTTVFLLVFLLVMGMTLAGKGEIDDVMQVVNQFWIGEIVMAIVTFYFGGGFMEGVLSKRTATGQSTLKVS
jgi:hypothetical protein